MCVGLAMIFGIMRVINFAQGDFMMLGMYITYFFFVLLTGHGMAGSPLGPYVSIVLTLPVMYVVGYLAHRLLISRVTGGKTAARSEEHTSELQSLMRISYAVFC